MWTLLAENVSFKGNIPCFIAMHIIIIQNGVKCSHKLEKRNLYQIYNRTCRKLSKGGNIKLAQHCKHSLITNNLFLDFDCYLLFLAVRKAINWRIKKTPLCLNKRYKDVIKKIVNRYRKTNLWPRFAKRQTIFKVNKHRTTKNEQQYHHIAICAECVFWKCKQFLLRVWHPQSSG